MRALLEEIRSGAFATEWKRERATGSPVLRERLAAEAEHPLEEVGRRVRRSLG
jgi:ketol-acid reductoisomerase